MHHSWLALIVVIFAVGCRSEINTRHRAGPAKKRVAPVALAAPIAVEGDETTAIVKSDEDQNVSESDVIDGMSDEDQNVSESDVVDAILGQPIENDVAPSAGTGESHVATPPAGDESNGSDTAGSEDPGADESAPTVPPGAPALPDAPIVPMEPISPPTAPALGDLPLPGAPIVSGGTGPAAELEGDLDPETAPQHAALLFVLRDKVDFDAMGFVCYDLATGESRELGTEVLFIDGDPVETHVLVDLAEILEQGGAYLIAVNDAKWIQLKVERGVIVGFRALDDAPSVDLVTMP